MTLPALRGLTLAGLAFGLSAATPAPTTGVISNATFTLRVQVQAGTVTATLEDHLAARRLADGPALYRAVRVAAASTEECRGLQDPVVTTAGPALTIVGRLAGLELEDHVVLPPRQRMMEERVVVRNQTGRMIALSDFEAGLERRVADTTGQVVAGLAEDRWVAVPLRVRASDPQGFVNDFSLPELLTQPGYEPWVDKDQQYSQVPSRHRRSEGWAWTHRDATLGIFTFSQENMLFSVVSTEKRTDGTWLRFGGVCMLSGEPAALTRVAPGQTVDLGVVRYQALEGGYPAAMQAFRDMLDEKGCRFPPGYNPPVHWEQLYDMPEAWTDRPHRYTKAILEREAQKGRAYGCQALYLDPGWDTDFGTFLWGERWLGPRRPFLEEMRRRYDLAVSLHCPLATWMSHQYSWGLGAVKSWPPSAARLAPTPPADDASRWQVPAIRTGRRNLALQPGAGANASSVFMGGAMAIHQIAHLNDGWYGNTASWIAGAMPAWAEIDLGQVCQIGEVRVGNDHTQHYTDRAATALRVMVATRYNAASTAPTWHTVAESTGRPLQAEQTFTFAPHAARWVRVELRQAGPDLPRLDELEVYEATPASATTATAYARRARRGAPPPAATAKLGPLVCLGSRQYREGAARRLEANCADGAVFLMYDGNWWNGGCQAPNHGHPIPYRYEDHIRANLDLVQRVHQQFPKVLIELHDPLAGGSPARMTPVYYKYGLPGSYDENWGFELMWDPMADLRQGRARALYYYNLGCNIPLYLHIRLTEDTASCVVLWWYASTCRHLGIGGVCPQPAVAAAQQRAMRRYRELEAFYQRGEFYGLDEAIHVHVLPAKGAFVVNVFNLSDQPRTIGGAIDLDRLGLERQRAYQSSAPWGTVEKGALVVRQPLAPWSADVAEFHAR